jgi:hypothetical protein
LIKPLRTNGRRYETLGIAWLRTYPPLLTLPAGAELANCTETAMFYDRLLAAGFYTLIICISILSSCTKLSMCGRRRASSFAIFGLRVGFVRIANVLDLVRGLATNFALIVF